jgi:hypothetical protein
VLLRDREGMAAPRRQTADERGRVVTQMTDLATTFMSGNDVPVTSAASDFRRWQHPFALTGTVRSPR